MNTTSPSKRRALAPVDANTRSPLGTPRLLPSKLDLTRPKTMALGMTLTEPSVIKRPIEQDNDRDIRDSAKRQRLNSTGAGPLSPRHDRSPQNVRVFISCVRVGRRGADKRRDRDLMRPQGHAPFPQKRCPSSITRRSTTPSSQSFRSPMLKRLLSLLLLKRDHVKAA